MAENIPIIFHPIELVDFLQWLLNHCAAPSTLVVASSWADFLVEVTASAHFKQDREEDAQDNRPNPVTRSDFTAWATISQLYDAQRLRVVCCSSVPTLNCYLSRTVIGNAGINGAENSIPLTLQPGRQPLLVLLNPIRVQQGSPTYSAQGLSRMFASAIEFAARHGQRLIIIECISRTTLDVRHRVLSMIDPRRLLEMDNRMTDDEAGPEDFENEGHNDLLAAHDDPWEQEVPILNMTTKNLSSNQRIWMGRTVKIRTIAERWCKFTKVEV